MLSACAKSIRLCLDVFHSIPHSRLFDVSYTTLTLLGHALVVLSKLCLLQTKTWDHTYTQDVLDFAESMDELIQKVNDATALVENTVEGDNGGSVPQEFPKFFSMLPATLRKIKFAHASMYAAQMSSSSQILQQPSAESDGSFMEDHLLTVPGPSFSDFFIEDFWQHLTRV